MPDPRNQFYDAMGGLGGKPGGVPTPPMRLPTDMAGPSPPSGPVPQMPNMSEGDAIKSEQGYYGPPTPQMLRGGRLPDIDLSLPAESDPGAMEALQASARKPPGTAGKWFVDQVEGGFARVEDPQGNVQTVKAQAGWKEGMHIDPPRAQGRKRRPVP